MTNETEKLALHFKYCAFILIMVIIAIATDRWTAQKDFTTYLSNAATMTSLVLGLVAIFYSFISNDSLSKSLGSITTVSADVTAARDQVGQYLQLTKTATDASAANASLLHGASNDITTTLVSLEHTLKSIGDQNQTLQGLVASLPTRIDQLETKFGDVAKALGEKPQQPLAATSQTDISARAVERFLARATLSQNLLTYACVLAGKEKKELSIAAVCTAIALNQPSTLNGFMAGMHAMLLISRKLVVGQDKVYFVTTIHPEIDCQTREYFVNYLEENYKEQPIEKGEWLIKMKNIEALFISVQ